MNMFSKSTSTSPAQKFNVLNFQYRSTNETIPEDPVIEEAQELPAEPEVTLPERVLNERLSAERAAGYAAAETELRSRFEEQAKLGDRRILSRIEEFEKTQKDYFSRLESEVVQLALAIAGKILHRESQVDPMLLSAIVHLALGQLREGSSATIRVRPEQADRWSSHVASLTLNLDMKIVEDSELEAGDCMLETELGMVNFSLDAQLKEIERGFFDVLAQKPQI